MKPQNPLLSITGALLLGAAFAAAPRASAQTLGYATQVLDYTVGTGSSASLTNPNAALGQPGGNVGSGTLNPFSPNYAASELTGIGMGGQLTLQLSNYVTVGAAGTREIGFYGNVGLVNTGTTGAPAAGNPATVFGLRSVLISVSADGINYVPVNGGALITSTLPANYYTNPDTTNVNAPPPANPTLADFGKPFMGSLADFNGESYAQTLTTLNGSAGGTWLDLASTGLSQVGFVRFNEPATGGANGGVFYLNGVSSNGALLGDAVPEPGTWALLAAAGAGLLATRFRRRTRRTAGGLAILAAIAVVFGGWTPGASAQMLDFAQITNWTGTGNNEAALVIDWNDGKNPESLVWGYRFNGTTTGLDLFQAIDAADPRLALFVLNDPQYGAFVYGIGYDLNNNGGTYNVTPVGDETGTPSDPNDHYAEGYDTRYWAYYVNDTDAPYNGASPYNGGAWTYADSGASTQQVVNGSWNGYSISDADFNAPVPGLPTPADAVPEPSSLLAAGLGLGAIVFVARRRVDVRAARA